MITDISTCLLTSTHPTDPASRIYTVVMSAYEGPDDDAEPVIHVSTTHKTYAEAKQHQIHILRPYMNKKYTITVY